MQIIVDKDEEKEKEVATGESNKVPIVTEEFDSEPGYYQQIIRPMLRAGHEEELCEWLKQMGLLQQTVKCTNIIENEMCGSIMQWSQARNVDKYQWICSKCNSKKNIRDLSIFKPMRCSLASVMRVFLGWCKNMTTEEVAKILHLKRYVVKRIYDTCSEIAVTYYMKKKNNFKFGGNENIVIIDVFPKPDIDDFEYNNNLGHNITPILCIGEIKHIPTRFLFYHLKSKNGFVDIPIAENSDTMTEVLAIINENLLEGTIIVINSDTFEDLKVRLQQCNKYSVIITNDELAYYDVPYATSLAENLETIWAPAEYICEKIQMFKRNINKVLVEQMWRCRFSRSPSHAFEYLIHHTVDYKSFKSTVLFR